MDFLIDSLWVFAIMMGPNIIVRYLKSSTRRKIVLVAVYLIVTLTPLFITTQWPLYTKILPVAMSFMLTINNIANSITLLTLENIKLKLRAAQATWDSINKMLRAWGNLYEMYDHNQAPVVLKVMNEQLKSTIEEVTDRLEQTE